MIKKEALQSPRKFLKVMMVSLFLFFTFFIFKPCSASFSTSLLDNSTSEMTADEGENSTYQKTYHYDSTDGTNTYLLCTFSRNDHDELTHLSSVTYDGVEMTLLYYRQLEDGPYTNESRWVKYYGLINPTSGNNTLLATLSFAHTSWAGVMCNTIEGIDQENPYIKASSTIYFSPSSIHTSFSASTTNSFIFIRSSSSGTDLSSWPDFINRISNFYWSNTYYRQQFYSVATTTDSKNYTFSTATDGGELNMIELRGNGYGEPPGIDIPDDQSSCGDYANLAIFVASSTSPNYTAYLSVDDTCGFPTPGWVFSRDVAVGLTDNVTWLNTGSIVFSSPNHTACFGFWNKTTLTFDYLVQREFSIYPSGSEQCSPNIASPLYTFCVDPCEGLATSSDWLSVMNGDNWLCFGKEIGCYLIKPTPESLNYLSTQLDSITDRFPISPFTKAYEDLTLISTGTQAIAPGHIGIPIYSTTTHQYISATTTDLSPPSSFAGFTKFRRLEIMLMWVGLAVVPTIIILTMIIL
jgi:hypothetical protein